METEELEQSQSQSPMSRRRRERFYHPVSEARISISLIRILFRSEIALQAKS